MKEPYSILGVQKTASDEDIKKTYRALAKKFHPDLNPGNSEAETKFKEIQHAYEQIGSVESRAKFDKGELSEQQPRSAHERSSYYQGQQNGGRYSQSYDKNFQDADFFENLFRGANGQTRSQRETGNKTESPGEDHLYHLEIDFKDTALGAEREISMPTGKRLLIKIPPGIKSGTKLRFKKQGGPGVGIASPGDALVEIFVKSAPGFNRVGNNIETELPLSFQEAILGAEVKVETIDGHVMLQVPAGTSTGSRLRIRGKGILTGTTRGDQIVVTKIVLPKTTNPKLQNAIRELSSEFSYNPRTTEVL